MTNQAYCLKMHHRRIQYLHARLDTCADVSLMLVAIYQLMFKDPSLKKLTPSTLEIETYTNDIVKIIGLYQFYLVHPEKKTNPGHFLHGQRKWECSIVMQNNYGTGTDQTMCSTRLSATKG